ncbi:MAG: hypothetical protein K5753_06555, partial [Clostridia bacterium]|nr:hypothetical protein [Clostridia bacterium]
STQSDYKQTLLLLLSHKELDKQKLLLINAHIDTPEAFYKLLVIYLTDKSSLAEFVSFLKTNIKWKGEYKQNNGELLNRITMLDPQKATELEKWAN